MGGDFSIAVPGDVLGYTLYACTGVLFVAEVAVAIAGLLGLRRHTMTEKQREQARSNLLARDVLPAGYVFDAQAVEQMDRLALNDRRASSMMMLGLGVCQMLVIVLCVVLGMFTSISAGDAPFNLSTLFLALVMLGIQVAQLFPILSLHRSRSTTSPQATTKLVAYRPVWLPLLYLVPIAASIAVSTLIALHRVPAAYYINPNGIDGPPATYPPLWLLILLPSLQLFFVGVTEALARLARYRTLGEDGLDAPLITAADTYWRRRIITSSLYGSVGLLIGVFTLASSEFELLSDHTVFVTAFQVTPFAFFIGLAIFTISRILVVARSVVKLVP